MLSKLRQKQEKLQDNYNDNAHPDSVCRQDENEILI